MASTSSETPPAPSTKAPTASSGRIAGLAGRFWLGRLWLAKAWLRRTVLGALGLFLAIILFAVFALPPIVIAQAERATEQLLHRRLTIEKIVVHPFSLVVSVQGVRLMEPNGTTPFASFDELDVRVSPASLVYFAPVIREVHLIRPSVHWVRTAPHAYSTDDILAALAAPAPAPAPTAAAARPRFAVHNIHVDGGRVDFDDVPEGAHHTVTDLAFGVPFVSSFVAEEEVFVEPHLHAVINGAPLQITGKTLPFASAPEAIVNLDFDDIDLARYAKYLPETVPFRMPSGRGDLHVQVNAQLPKNQEPHVSLAGKVTLKALELTDVAGKTLLKLDVWELAIAQAHWPAGPLDLGVTVNGASRLAVAGQTAGEPLRADLDVQIDDLNLLPLQPLFADRLNLRMTSALVGGKGHVKVEQDAGGALGGNFQGDVTLAKLATVDAVDASDFVSWDALALRGLRVQLAPLAVHLDEVALSKFYARVIINPSGRINLQDIVRGKSEAQRSITTVSAADQGAEHARAPAAQTPAPATKPPPTAAALAAAGPPISIGKLVMEKGHVRFTDNFIRPKYSADLMDLGGTVSGLSSDPGSAAQIDLHGKVNGAPLLIGGRINPLARELSFDVKASVHDMELAPLTSYSAKYVGYRIERGKLSFDVEYQLENRQLHAENRLVLDQLTFGEKVESPSATSLPVLLAVALLKDRNGVIDINLPIGGSLDDPQFSVGGLIVKVLINLVTKAITAPFALLGHLFGGGEQLSWLDFPPGQYAVTPDLEPKLKSLATALTERPNLNLDITGWADPEADREALRQHRLESKLRALKRKDLGSKASSGGAGAEVVVTPQERPALLKRVYEAEFAPQPAPVTAPPGLASARAEAAARLEASAAAAKMPKLTQQEMEQALLAKEPVTDDDLLNLGNRRSEEVKAWLTTIGLVPEERLSIVAARIGAAPPASTQEAPQGATVAGAAPPAAAPPSEAPPPAAAARTASRVEFGLH